MSDKSSGGDSDTLSSISSTLSLQQEQDTVTNWAVLVGKALWCYMKGKGQQGQREQMGLISSAVNFSFGNCTAVEKSKRRAVKID